MLTPSRVDGILRRGPILTVKKKKKRWNSRPSHSQEGRFAGTGLLTQVAGQAGAVPAAAPPSPDSDVMERQCRHTSPGR